MTGRDEKRAGRGGGERGHRARSQGVGQRAREGSGSKRGEGGVSAGLGAVAELMLQVNNEEQVCLSSLS